MAPEKSRPGQGFLSRIGLKDALEQVQRHIRPLDTETVPLERGLYRSLSRQMVASVNSPTDDVSLKDGFAVKARNTAQATAEKPERFQVVGTQFAGEAKPLEVVAGTAAGVLSGALIPEGADAVVANEFCTETAGRIAVSGPVSPGQNILPKGTDIRAGTVQGEPGDLLTPGKIGCLAAAGLDRASVFKRPRAALVALGSEVVAPGTPLRKGQLYASNLYTLASWLRAFGVSTTFRVLPDEADALRSGLPLAAEGADVLLPSGGAWGSERDLVVGVLDDLGWQKIFHRVRIGPGKAVAFGLLGGRPVFCLPGGPPSNEMAFLQLAMPGILKMAGWRTLPFPYLKARLSASVNGRDPAWTQLVRAHLFQDREGIFWAVPGKEKSRLESMARAECLIPVPEGVKQLEKDQWVRVQLLVPPGPSSVFDYDDVT